MGGSITAGEYEYGAFAISSIQNTIDNGLLNYISWTLHGFSVIGWTPATAIDRRVLISVVECCSLVYIGYCTREDTKTSNFRLVGNSYTTKIVFLGSNLSSTAGPVMVVEKHRSGQIDVVIEII